MSNHPARLAGAATLATLVVLLSAGVAAAHVVKQAGPYTIEIGWQHEPTYVGDVNGVQIIVHDADDQPITDLIEDDLKVVVSTGSEQTGELVFEPGFDLERLSRQELADLTRSMEIARRIGVSTVGCFTFAWPGEYSSGKPTWPMRWARSATQRWSST